MSRWREASVRLINAERILARYPLVPFLNVFGMTRPWIEPTASRFCSGPCNHYAIGTGTYIILQKDRLDPDEKRLFNFKRTL